MSNNWVFEDLNKYDMDGVDFTPLFWKPYAINNEPIYKSYTRAEYKEDSPIIKTNYYFWKMVDGKKEYYTWEGEKYEII